MERENPREIKDLFGFLGPNNLSIDKEFLGQEVENTLGIRREIAGIVCPSNVQEVVEVVEVANMHHIPLYPISKGKNIGYGDKVPVLDSQLIMDLGKMNTIRAFDEVHGHVILEPGVTQKQLFDFLQEHNAEFWMDTTGSGLESSIVGNALEGGFGHTQKGNRRNTMSNLEVVLGNGLFCKQDLFLDWALI